MKINNSVQLMSLVAMVAAGCSAKIEGLQDPIGDKQLLAPSRDLLSRIQGTWATACINEGTGSAITQLSISGSLADISESKYSEAECRGSVSTQSLSAAIEIGNPSASVSGAYDLDINVNGFRAPSLVMLDGDRLFLGEDSADGVTRPTKLKLDRPMTRVTGAVSR